MTVVRRVWFPALITCALASGVAGPVGAAAPAAARPSAVEVCINQTLFNGIWRVRATKVEPLRRKGHPDLGIPDTGWGVAMQWTNATSASQSVPNSGAGNIELLFSSDWSVGRQYAYSEALSGKGEYDSITRDEDQTGRMQLFNLPGNPKGVFPPGVTRKGELKFWYPAHDPHFSGKPTKLVVARADYTRTRFRPFRIDLTCMK